MSSPWPGLLLYLIILSSCPRPSLLPPGISQCISHLLTRLVPKMPLIFLGAVTKQFKPDFRRKKSEVGLLLHPHRPHPSGCRLELVGAGRAWSGSRRGLLQCLCSALPPSAAARKSKILLQLKAQRLARKPPKWSRSSSSGEEVGSAWALKACP